MNSHERNQQVLTDIDEALAAGVPSIEEGLDSALESGRISQEEHDECLAEYNRTFHWDVI